MGMMKNLAIALEDGALDNPSLDESRRLGWNNSLVGTYFPEHYAGDHKRAYQLGNLQYRAAINEHNDMRNGT